MKISLLHLLPVLSDTRKKNLMTTQQCTVPRILANFLGHPIFLIFESPRSRTWGKRIQRKGILFNKGRVRNGIREDYDGIGMVFSF